MGFSGVELLSIKQMWFFCSLLNDHWAYFILHSIFRQIFSWRTKSSSSVCFTLSSRTKLKWSYQWSQWSLWRFLLDLRRILSKIWSIRYSLPKTNIIFWVWQCSLSLFLESKVSSTTPTIIFLNRSVSPLSEISGQKSSDIFTFSPFHSFMTIRPVPWYPE